MARQEPLLAPPRHSSEHSSINNEDEEDALLTGQRTNRTESPHGWRSWQQAGLFTWAFLATIAVIILAVIYQRESVHQNDQRPSWGPGGKPLGKRNLIFMVSDGMGPTSLSLTRTFRQTEFGLPVDDTLVIDEHHIGTSRTRSTSSLVTDSAAGATAFSCGFKSYNGAISVLPDHSPCGTVLEAAKLAGYTTGLVVTTRITDATPACFVAHANLRSYEDLIAEQEVGEHPLGRVVDLMLGGGRCHFLANGTEGSCRADNRDLVQQARDNGFHYINSRKQFDELNNGKSAELPLMGLFSDKDIPYEIDRQHLNDVYPSLEEMTVTALTALSKATKDNEKGFFIMIEGSRIDHAGHGNDPAAQVHEVIAYDKAFAAALDFLEQDSTPGVVVSTSDHETGGLATARQLRKTYPEYRWLPGILTKASHSSEYLHAKLLEYLSGEGYSASTSRKRDYVRRNLIEDGLGIEDATDEEIDLLLNQDPGWSSSYVFADMISRRAQVGWTTHGHSAVDVNIYASSTKDAWPLVGNHENIEIGSFLADYLDVDVEAVTQKLRSSSAFTTTSSAAKQQRPEFSWMGDPLGADINVDHLDTYHGDFRKRFYTESNEDDFHSAVGGCACGVTH